MAKFTSRLFMMTTLSDFDIMVYALTAQIPAGMIATYKSIAIYAGNKNASRVVGKILSKNPYAPDVPCHRVIRSDGSVGGFFGSSDNSQVCRKISLLKQEGVDFGVNYKLTADNLSKHKFTSFKPLSVDDAKVVLATLEHK